MKDLAVGKGGKCGTGREKEDERMLVGGTVVEAHLGVESEALAGLVNRGVSLDEFIVEKHSFVWNKIEELVGISDVRCLDELNDEKLSLVLFQAIFESVNNGFFQLVHARLIISTQIYLKV
ncbi:hypothetical protein GQ457_02G001340 [Hibiscus cannabinus]